MNNSYSKLYTNTQAPEPKWHNMPQTEVTKIKRNKVKALLDNFTSFSWRGVDAWDNFGAFIINNGDSLKLFNGATWSNEYSNPQFGSRNNQLTGMNFKTPSFGFTMGVYWFSDEEYRYLLEWLSPYEINELSFGYDTKHYYQVKLASVSQGTRYFLENELLDGKKISRYYTEIKLTFEIQGPVCAYNKDQLVYSEWYTVPQQDNLRTIQTLQLPEGQMPSDLDFPIEVEFTITLNQESRDNSFPNINFCMQTSDNPRDSYELFSCTFQNLAYNSGLVLKFKYTSEDGLLFWSQGDSKFRLLSSLSTLSTGYRLIHDISSNIFNLPGHFNAWAHNMEDFTFRITSDYRLTCDAKIAMRGRTNAI